MNLGIRKQSHGLPVLCTVLLSKIRKGKCVWMVLAWLMGQSATETNSSVSSRTTKPAFLWIHVSRLISSEILSL